MRRTWPALVVAVVAVAAACSSGDDGVSGATTEPTSPPESTGAAGPDDVEAPPWEPATRAEELALELSTSVDGPTIQQAVDVFGLHVEDFPGVTPSDLPPGQGFSGTYALGLISSMRDELTAEQTAVLEEYRDEGTIVARITPDGAVETVPAPSPTTPGPSGWRRAPSTSQVEEYSALLAEVQQAWASHLPGYPQHQSYELSFTPTATSVMDATEPEDGTDRCIIRVHPDYLSESPPPDMTRWIFAHEMFHCMQFRWAAGASWNPHPWVFDGSAEWATADLFRNRAMTYDSLYEEWFTSELKPLGGRQYDAWPLFENAHVNGYDVYGSIVAMFKSPMKGVAPMLAVGHLDGQVFRIDWSTRTLRWPEWGTTWWLDWPWSGNAAYGPSFNSAFLGSRGLGAYNIVGLGGFAQPQFIVTMTDDVGIVTVSPKGGPLTTHTASGTRTVGDGASGRFCFKPDGCRCPGGQTSGAVQMTDPAMVFSFAASEKSPVAAVLAEEWDPAEHCEEPEPGEGSSNGDPHLVTFDGLPYDVMTLGEFVLARDRAGGLEVQTRHEQFGFGAGTTAVAIGTAEHRVTFTMPEFFAAEATTMRVDGEVTTEQDFIVGDVRVVVRSDGDTIVAWPDGSTVRLHWYLGWFVTITAPADRAARMEGLLGSADGDLRNDLRRPDGTVVDTVDAAAPESPYALAWAVDETTSLFDYEPGESVDTFRIPHPRPAPPQVDPVLLDECATALGGEAAAHDVTSCAYDVSATGDDGFVEEYSEIVESRADSGGVDVPATIAVPATVPSQSAGPVAQGVTGEPSLTLGGDEAGTVAAAAGTVVLARAEACGDAYADLVVVKVGDDDALARATLCDPSGVAGVGIGDADEWVNGEAYVWVPGDGTYDVAVAVTLGDAQRLVVDIYTDSTPTIVEQQALDHGDQAILQGLGDTIVYLPDPEAAFAATGLDVACAVEVYWSNDFPHPEPRDLHACDHATTIDFPPTDQVVPIVVFNRTGDDITVELVPAE